MPGRDQGEDSADDSRTAAVGPRNKQKSNRVTKSSSQSARGRRSQRNRRSRRDNTQDFVLRGATFTNAALPVDGDSNSNSDRSSSDSGSEYMSPEAGEVSADTQTQAKIMQPAVNWNKAVGGGIRTSLRGTGGTSTPASASFDAVNEKYWRSRSGSPSNAAVENRNGLNPVADGDSAGKQRIPDEMDNGEKDAPMVISEDSELESDAEADNSILLNMRTPNQHATPGEEMLQENANNRQETLDSRRNGSIETHRQGPSAEVVAELHPASLEVDGSRLQADATKVAAIEAFSSKYPSAPHILSDLTLEDREVQVKYIYYNSTSKDVDLNLPVRCTDCMAEGHLSEVCPSKECTHCGAWGTHESRFCPSWRRCQRCRERGHDEEDCSSLLKALASEIPCDFCGSSEHIETECDSLWKIPKCGLSSSQIFISVCCSFCTSKQHLLGDCPIRTFPMNSSSWTLNAVDPSMIAHLGRSVPPVTNGDTGRDDHLTGLRIKGRANERPESDDDHGDFAGSARWKPLNKQPQRSHIRFDNGIGRGRNLGDDSSRQNGNNGGDQYVPRDNRRDYRDRDQFYGRNPRQRSLSPDPYPSRQRGGGGGGGANRYNPPRSPPRTRGRPGPPPPPGPPPIRGGSKKRGGSSSRGGRGAKSSDSRDVYRPLPSAAKRAWDKHRI